MKLNRRVVVTGMGMVSPLGNSVSTSWQRLLQGESGIQSSQSIPNFKDRSEVPQCALAPVHSSFNPKLWKVPFSDNRLSSFTMSAVHEALQDAKIDSIDESLKLSSGVIIGVMNSNIGKLQDIISDAHHKGFDKLHRFTIFQVLTNMISSQVAIKYNLKGPCYSVSTACSTGAQAIGEAYKNILMHEADWMIAGGSEDSMNLTTIQSSLRMNAMSSKIYDDPSQSSRPFDLHRSGFILGEGSGIVILEELNHALKRKAPIYGELIGYSCQSDGFHLTKPLPDGDGGYRAMIKCMNQGGISPNDINHINCHATSTATGDDAEIEALKKVFDKELLKKISITANKSQIGHCFGAAGSIETIFMLKSLTHNQVPFIKNLENPINDYIHFVKNQPLNQEINYALKNSFGFGGANTSLLFKKLQI